VYRWTSTVLYSVTADLFRANLQDHGATNKRPGEITQKQELVHATKAESKMDIKKPHTANKPSKLWKLSSWM
jgi:hypothetical protein